MKKLLQAKRIFVSTIDYVKNVQSDELDINTPCEVMHTSLGYRLLYKVNETSYIDILTGNKIKTYDSLDLEKGDLIIGSYLRPLYRYSKSLRVGEYRESVKKYAYYVQNFFNQPDFANNHDNFYKINDLVRQCHLKADSNKVPLTKKELLQMLFGIGGKSAGVDELFVVNTKIIDHIEKDALNRPVSCEGHPYKYVLAIRKWNGTYVDPLTDKEIKEFSNDISVGDIIVENAKPLYRYAKSLRIYEDLDDVKIYAFFVKTRFNLDEYKANHSKFYEINEIVRACHVRDKDNSVTKTKNKEETYMK